MSRIVLLFILTIILQTGLIPGLFPYMETPELFLPVIIALSILSTQQKAITFAVVAGLVMDFYFLKAFGVRTMIFFMVSFILSEKKETVSKSVFSIITLTFLIGILYQFIYYIFINLRLSISIKKLISSVFSMEIPILVLYSIVVYSILNKENRRR